MISFTLEYITKLIAGELRGDPSVMIANVAPLYRAEKNEITYCQDKKYFSLLASSQAAAVIIRPSMQEQCRTNALIVDNPEVAFARVAELFVEKISAPVGVHKTAVIGQNVVFGEGVSIGAMCVIGDNVRIGARTVILSGTVIGDNSAFGEDCVIHSQVTVYPRVTVNNRAIIHSGVVIGADGFGFARDTSHWVRIPQLGSVIIGNDVEIGSNTTIDRGAMDNTVIEDGVKLDNLIQVGHNVKIGAHTIIAGCVGIAGSAEIGKNCMIGGASSINGHIKIVDNVIITGTAMILRSIDRPGVYSSGTGMQENLEWRKSVARFHQLDEFVKRLTKLERHCYDSDE